MMKWIIDNKLAGGPHPIYGDFLYKAGMWEWGYFDAWDYNMWDSNGLDDLDKNGIKAIVSVSEDPISNDELEEYNFNYMHSSTKDGRAPSNLIQICEFIDLNINSQNPVFVHCSAGIGRTSTVLAAYMIYSKQITGKSRSVQAFRFMRKHYDPVAMETFEQFESLVKFSNSLK